MDIAERYNAMLLKQYEELADLIGKAVVPGNESYTHRELGMMAIHALENAGWKMTPPTTKL